MTDTTKIVLGSLGGIAAFALIVKFFSMKKSGDALKVDEDYRNRMRESYGGTRRKRTKSRKNKV